jgi:TPR repeat protein
MQYGCVTRRLSSLAFGSLLLAACADTAPTAGPRTASYDDGVAAFEVGDYPTAYQIWQPLAVANNCRAQFALGNMMRDIDVDRLSDADRHWAENVLGKTADDRREAGNNWLFAAADQNHAQAQTVVARGPLFTSGLGGLEDWEQAATNGDMYAMRRARDLYYYEKKRNDPTRLRGPMWALILRDKGDPWDTTARIIELFKEQLTPEQVREAEEAAAAWRTSHVNTPPWGPC